MRTLVAQSWKRSAAAGIDADHAEAPLRLEHRDLLAYRASHPLSAVFPLLHDVLGRAAEASDCVMAVGDDHGQLLWVCGRPDVLRRAEGINFVEGTSWGEELIGTNAPGTALRLDAPVQISSREHFNVAYKPWSCAAAPIHHPETGRILGVVDVTGGDAVDLPQTLALVRSVARLAESELGRLSLQRRLASQERVGPTRRATRTTRAPRTTRPVLVLRGLGRPDCEVVLAGRTVRLSPRHGDVMAVLADAPEGVTAERLATEVHEEEVRPSTTRAQVTRLRALLGPGVLESRPYRLVPEVRADWLEVAGSLRAGRLAEAVRSYRGPLLPESTSPGVARRRDALERDLVAALLASQDVELLTAATRSGWAADDLALWERQAALLDPGSPLRLAALSQVRRLRIEYGLEPAPGRPPLTRSRLGRM
ncbi:Acetoin dehydrogenase operon transcriptional activator AcoR [Nocardioides aquaticus]|uniref:Acetoin dehydrogenase operon transcriptional activator AcoR n=1 Tax=Nocardioides aquaticus TaxID=160826 RepID=A0ABX8EE67_9ACTN|nr:GAF domain-containing protein [Nocardioides aquaticus]QVT78771.1 Acetoin dehydrogenase operon transcriptional activator AcoR [Nocardioides aquaticus]